MAVAGCNSLLGNSEHGVAPDDASTIHSVDGGSVGDSGSSETDAGVGERDAQRADAQEGTSDGGTDADEDDGALPPIEFVQVADYDSKSSAATASVTYSSPQQAGDLDVVVVGWSDPSHTIRAISDKAGNSYALAAAQASTTGATLAIYFAANIAGAASNTVTVDLDGSDYPCVAILEYSGVTQVDRTAMGTGSSNTASTATVMTSLPRELVFGAGEPDQNGTTNFASAGAGFNERIITGISGMLAEDAITSEAGTYAATAGLTSVSPWVMQVVTFK
jgi:hypothetical protein